MAYKAKEKQSKVFWPLKPKKIEIYKPKKQINPKSNTVNWPLKPKTWATDLLSSVGSVIPNTFDEVSSLINKAPKVSQYLEAERQKRWPEVFKKIIQTGVLTQEDLDIISLWKDDDWKKEEIQRAKDNWIKVDMGRKDIPNKYITSASDNFIQNNDIENPVLQWAMWALWALEWGVRGFIWWVSNIPQRVKQWDQRFQTGIEEGNAFDWFLRWPIGTAINSVIGDIVWGTVWGATEWALRWVVKKEDRKKVERLVNKAILNIWSTEPAQVAQEIRDNFDQDTKERISDYTEIGANALDIIPATGVGSRAVGKFTDGVINKWVGMASNIWSATSKLSPMIPSVTKAKNAKKSFQKVKDTISEYYTDLWEADKKAMKSNPYIPKYAQEVIEKVKKDWIPLDNDDLISDALQKNADRVVKWLEDKKNIYDEQWKLYNDLRDALSDEIIDNNTLRQEIVSELPEWKTLQWFIKDVDEQWYGWLSKVFEVADDGKTLINPNITIPKLHDMRKSVDKLINAVENKGTAKEPTLVKIRKVIDKKLKENQLWKENDEIYSEMREAYDKLKEWLVYKDRTRLNEPRDNIVQIIKNLNTPNRKKLKDRIMKDFPWLDKEIEALNYMPRFTKKYLSNPKITAWLVTWWVVWSTMWWIGAIIGAGLWWLWSALWSKRLWGKKRNIVEGIVSRMSKAQQGELEDIAKQIKKASQTNTKSFDVMKKQKERITKRKADAKTRELLEKILKNATKEEKAMLPDLWKEVFEAWPEWVKRKIGDKPAWALIVNPKTKQKPKVIEFSSPSRLDSKQTTIWNFTRKMLSKEEIDLLDWDLKDKYNEFSEAIYSKDYWKLDWIFTKVNEWFESGLYDPRQQKIMDKMLDSAQNDGWYIEWISNKDIVPETNYTEMFRKEAEKIEAMEQRIGKVWNQKVWKEYKDKQRKEWTTAKEKVIENIREELNLDANQAQDYYDNLLSKASKDVKPKKTKISKPKSISK